ncbi:MAG: RIP metalloprotease RseP [Desulfobacterales bacterium]|nr:RIP metalloprotease RseP [Pseudomonadota bacterium]MCG2773986.1 RIP metalloprotease RseP [Desulfobacterales bacterium]
MITVLATIIVLGVLVFVHELGHFLMAKFFGVRVDAFSLGFPPKLLHKKIGDTDYRLSVVPLGGYVKLFGENPKDEVPPELQPVSFSHHPLWHRFLIVLAGPAFNLIFAALALFLVFTFSGIPYLTTEIGGVKEGSPAAQAGLQKGDQILSVGGQAVSRWEHLSAKIRQNGEKPLTLSVRRGDRDFQVQVTPQRMETSDIFGAKVSAVIIGVSSGDTPAVEQVGPIQALTLGVVYTGRLTWLTVESLYKLVAREVPLKSIGGPILIAQMAGKQAEMGVSYLVQFMAALSINLFLINLLPIPVLDGGHLFFFTLEAIRGKPLPLPHREMAQGLGLMLLLALMILVFYQDILRLVQVQY